MDTHATHCTTVKVTVFLKDSQSNNYICKSAAQSYSLSVLVRVLQDYFKAVILILK